MFSAQDRTEESHSRFAKNPEMAGLSMAPAQMGVGHREPRSAECANARQRSRWLFSNQESVQRERHAKLKVEEPRTWGRERKQGRGQCTDQEAEPGDVGEGGGDGGGGEREHAGEVPHHHVGRHLDGVLRQVHHHHGQGQVPHPPGLARPPPPPLLVLLRRPRQQKQRPCRLVLLPRGGHLGLGHPPCLPRRGASLARRASPASPMLSAVPMLGAACVDGPVACAHELIWAKRSSSSCLSEALCIRAGHDTARHGTASTRRNDSTCQAVKGQSHTQHTQTGALFLSHI